MATPNVIHYVLKEDYQNRNGDWARHFSATYDGIERRVTTRLGALWNNLLQRTKPGSKFQSNKPSYAETVNEFSSFEDFCEFCFECPGFGMLDENGKAFSLDKDILGNGKVYSRATCCFVPTRINNLLLDKGGKKESHLPSGITLLRGKYRVRDGAKPEQFLFSDLEDAKEKKNSLRNKRIENSLVLVSYDDRIVNALTRKIME